MPTNTRDQVGMKGKSQSAGGAVQALNMPNAGLLRGLGGVFLLVAIIGAFILVLGSFGSITMPGCGPGSSCADLSNGKWGSIPWGDYKWPVSYLGLAYFVAVLVAWLATPGGVSSLFRWMIRLGVAGSVGFIMIMIVEQKLCKYCLVCHAGNIAFWIVAEAARWRAIPAGKPIAIYLAAFVIGTGALAVIDKKVRHEAAIKDESDLQDSIKELVESAGGQAATSGPKQQTPASQSSTPVQPAPGATATQSAANPSGPDSGIKVTVQRGNEPARELETRTVSPASQAAPTPSGATGANDQPTSAQAQASPAKAEAAPAKAEPAPAKPDEKQSSKPAASQPQQKPSSADAPATSKPPLPPGWDWESILSQEDPFKDGFCGRYVTGPREAPVRIVMFTDYQCPDCKRVESEIQGVLEKYPNDVSLSVKLFPFDQSCNPTADRTLHPNACWAARAAEAAGMLWGNEGFWKMHRWLFDRKGIFETTKVLEEGVRSIGYDPAGFVPVVTGPEALKRIESDIKEARWCGIFQTPMIFINGHEIRGWRTTNGVPRAVEALLKRRPPARDHSEDHPPIALEKMVGDWRESGRRQMPPDSPRHSVGRDGAPVQVVVWGDFEESTTAETDLWFQDYVAKHEDTQYTFCAFPFNQDCNRCMKFTRFDQACWAARAAEAGWKLKGEEGYWAVHNWLMRNQETHNDDALRQAAPQLGIEANALFEAMQNPDVENAIKDDVNGADKVSLQAIPLIFINGKQVGRWRVVPERSYEVLELIIDEAAGRRPAR